MRLCSLCECLCAQVSGLPSFSLQKAITNPISDISVAAVVPLSQVSWAQEYFWGGGEHLGSLMFWKVGCSVVLALL